MWHTLAGPDIDRKAARRELTTAIEFAQKVLDNPAAFDDDYAAYAGELANAFGADDGLRKVLAWAGQGNDDNLVLYQLLNPYTTAAFLLGLVIGYRPDITGGAK